MLRSFICFTFSLSVAFSFALNINPIPKPEIQQMKEKKSFASFKMRGEGKHMWMKNNIYCWTRLWPKKWISNITLNRVNKIISDPPISEPFGRAWN